MLHHRFALGRCSLVVERQRFGAFIAESTGGTVANLSGRAYRSASLKIAGKTILPITEYLVLTAVSYFKDTFRTPVYTTSQRRNAMGVGLVFVADLRTEKHTSHWILQGVCLTLNTD